MTKVRTISLALLAVIVAGCTSGCATTATGKAIQAAHVQKQLVELAAVEFAKAHLCAGLKVPPPSCIGRPTVSDAMYTKGKIAYQKWYDSELALAATIATWQVIKSAENDQKVQIALNTVSNDVSTYLNLVAAFVDLPALQKKVDE